MSEKVITSRAKWVLAELIPVVIMLGVGLLGVVMGVTEVFTTEGAYILAIPGFALFAFLVYENLKRKKRSTLNAKLENDEKYTLSVWMTKPNKDKWKGRLDANGKNKAALVDTKQIAFEDVQGTPVVAFKLGKGNQMIVPTRIIEDKDEVRLYIVEGISNAKNVSFASPKDKSAFETVITGNSIKASALKEKTDIAAPTKEWEKDKRATRTDYSSLLDEEPALGSSDSGSDSVKEEEAPVVPKGPVQATQVIGYGKYDKKSNDDLISEALDKAEAKLDEAAASQDEWEKDIPLKPGQTEK